MIEELWPEEVRDFFPILAGKESTNVIFRGFFNAMAHTMGLENVQRGDDLLWHFHVHIHYRLHSLFTKFTQKPLKTAWHKGIVVPEVCTFPL